MNKTAREITAPPARRRLPRVRIIVTVVILLIAAMVIPFRVRVNRQRVVDAMSRSLGRPVSIGSIHYRLLPWPGFTIEGFSVADDPAFSLEPVIRADNVTADIRLASLWRGHLEISRVHLDEPSLNLVRNDAGLWNIQSILLRASQIPSAPTNKKLAEQRVRFPYIEATQGRVNFRLGNEKKALTFMESDFALWLGAEDRWNLEFSARPARTDTNLTDLGTVHVRGTIQRAATLATTPLNLHLSWDYAQLGQTTKLIFGQDGGWRSAVTLTGDLAGTLNDLAFTVRLTLDGFRRADIVPVNSLTLHAECSGHAHDAANALSPLHCVVPLGGGLLSLGGSVEDLHGTPRPELHLSAENIPASALLAVARRVKSSIPDDLQANGTFFAEFDLAEPEASATRVLEPGGGMQSASQGRWKGAATFFGLQLISTELKPPLLLGDVKFEKGMEPPPPRATRHKRRQPLPATTLSPDDVNLLPLELDLGGPATARIDGQISMSDITLRMQGPFRLQRLLALGGALGMRPVRTSADGDLQGNLSLTGPWHQLRPPVVTGVVTLGKVQWSPRQVNEPIALAGGTLLLTPDSARLSGVDAEIGKTVTLHGDVGFHRGCSPITECSFRFELASPSLNADALVQLLTPRERGFSLFGSSSQPSSWQWLRAQGTISVDQAQIGKLMLHRCSSFAEIAQSTVSLHALRCQVLHGDGAGDWTLDFNGDQPKFSGNGKLTHAAIADLEGLLHEDWGGGWFDADYKIGFSGAHVRDFAASAQGGITLSIENGVWKHAHVPLSGPLQFLSWRMPMELSSGSLKLRDGLIKLPRQTLAVNGTIGLDRDVNLIFTPAENNAKTSAFSVEGTLQNPTLSSAGAARSASR